MCIDDLNPKHRRPWTPETLADPHGQADKASRVQAMFNAIAPTYERVNKVASFGQDSRWRRKAVELADVDEGDTVLDICSGTGDMIRMFASVGSRPAKIIGLDFAAEMLHAGRYDDIDVPIELVQGDAMDLPFEDASVDVVSCAFGVRNFQKLHGGLCEMSRVLRPAGRLTILEFANPEIAVFRWGCRAYCNWVLPRVGQWISKDSVGAYKYLPRSIQTFETRQSMIHAIEDAGFCRVSTCVMNFGSVVVYRAEKPEIA